MSKKTAPKKTKKPTQLHRATETRKKPTIADDLHVLKESFEAQAEFLIDWRKRLNDRLTALESRSAPAEVWVPKVGEIAVLLPFRDGGDHLASGVLIKGDPEPTRITFANRTGDHKWYFRTEKHCKCDFPADRIRPATPAEIADHKAKEEQRAKEAEWAKFDVLQEGDATPIADPDLIALMGANQDLCCSNETVLYAGRGLRIEWRRGGYIQAGGSNVGKELPSAEFLRRLQGTIAKRAEDERAKELAKPLEFGTRVKWGSFTGRVACEGPDHQNEYLVAYKPGNGSVWHSTWVHRCDLTVID